MDGYPSPSIAGLLASKKWLDAKSFFPFYFSRSETDRVVLLPGQFELCNDLHCMAWREHMNSLSFSDSRWMIYESGIWTNEWIKL